MHTATRTSKHPLGGINGHWRHRLLRFHAPLAVACGLILALFVTLPRLDIGAFSVMDTRSGAAIPQKLDESDLQEMEEMHRDEGGSEVMDGMDGVDHSGGQGGSNGMNHGGSSGGAQPPGDQSQ